MTYYLILHFNLNRKNDYQCVTCNFQHSLNGKRPLHFVVEKKDSAFLSWFLDVVRYFAERQMATSSPSLEWPGHAANQAINQYVRKVVNEPAATGATALHVAASLKMEPGAAEQRTRILQLLLENGAEFSTRTDAKLRAELAKDPKVSAPCSTKNKPQNFGSNFVKS